MAKIKLRKIHKIKIHPNRYLIWAIAYLLFVAIAMLGYLKVVNLGLENEGSESVFKPLHAYANSSLGFGLRYPADWSIEAGNSTVAFLPSAVSDEGVTVSVLASSSEAGIRKTLNITKESSIQINNSSASKIINNLGQNHSETVVIVPHGKQIYVIRGSGVLVDRLLQTFYIINK